MKTGQLIAGLGVIEQLGRFPIREVMTLQATVSELTFVHIFMARYATLRQPKEGLRKIFHFDECAILGIHVSRNVAFLARNARVLSFQVIARQTMIKLFLRRLPVDETEIHAVVIEMASHAVLAVRVTHSEPGVIPMIRSKPLRDLFVAVEALERGCARSELMAACTLSRACQGLMRLGEWPR